MPKYEVEFYSATGWAHEDIEAVNPTEALKAARQLIADDPFSLLWDETQPPPVERIVVLDQEGETHAEWDLPKSECPYCK